jgi:hypothetical protein
MIIRSRSEVMFDHSTRQMPQLPRAEARNGERVLDRVEQALDGLRYGEVTVIVQDGIVVQVERTDRMRLARSEQQE